MSKLNIFSCFFISTVLMVGSHVSGQQLPKYKNPVYPLNERVEDLLVRMTLEEKVGQINMPCVYIDEFGKSIEEKTENCRKLTEGKFMEGIGPLGGFFTLADNLLHEGPIQQASFFNELQEIAIKKTRLGIPLLQAEEGTHGLMCSGGTIFPEGLGIGSNWNMDLVKDIYSVVAREARSIGIHHLYTLVIEPNRDPRLGRNQEGYSEDPYLCSRLAETIVDAIQGNDVSAKDKAVAGLCHYPGQSEPVGGMERGAMEISERKLREVFLPPWEAGIKKGRALGVMATYPAIDGIPTHASEFLLTDILRNELGFEGVVLSEGGGIKTLIDEAVAPGWKEAGELAMKAGVDVGISFEDAYLKCMIENVKEGKVPMGVLDRAVRRILALKFRLGLFDNPYVNPAVAETIVHTKDNQDIALESAREGIVLLKNARLPGQENNLLPLKKNIKKIAVIGPNANNERNLLGDYIAESITQDIVTVLEGIENSVISGSKVEYVKGCNVFGSDFNEIPKAVQAASNADIAVVVLGENERHSPEGGSNGERRDVRSLNLTGIQEDLLKAVYETGTPTVLVLVNGRPLSVPWAAGHIPAIIETWLPGEKGGQAIADILFGDYNPSGRLPITIPRHVGQLPAYYNYTFSKQKIIDEAKIHVDMPATPLWEFGFGLSYTNFEYSNLNITPKETGTNGEIKISFNVSNTGKVKGKEVAQLYVRDCLATVTTPARQLRGFRKISLEPGETKMVEFVLKQEDLAIYNPKMEYGVEPGSFEVMVGSSSADIRLKGEFEIREDNASSRLKDDYEKVHQHLYNELIPFWDDRAVDTKYGGFLTNFDARGNTLEMPEKYLNTQCRLIWWFSQLHMLGPREEYRQKAKQGVDFLIKYLWDEINGGWRWKVKKDGSPLDDAKIVYGQSFAIYALSDYYLSTGDKRGLEYAEKTFNLLQKYCADTLHGGYYENLEADWAPAPGGFSAGDRKGLDTHMHLMEAFTSLYQASGEELHKRKLVEIINLINEKMVDHEAGSGLNQFDMAWNSLPAINIKRTWNAEREGEKPADPTETTSYGHNTELVWLMVRALNAAGEPVDPYKPTFKKLLDNAVKYGIDPENGGIYRDGLRKGGALVLEKEWWQHTESLVGFLAGYGLFHDVKYIEAFQAIWSFVDTKMINHETGEWRRLLTRKGDVIDGNIGNEWKVAYHSGRSMLECERRLKQFMMLK